MLHHDNRKEGGNHLGLGWLPASCTCLGHVPARITGLAWPTAWAMSFFLTSWAILVGLLTYSRLLQKLNSRCYTSTISILTLTFNLHLSLRAFERFYPYVLRQMLVDHWWANMRVEPGHSIPSSSHSMLILTWDLLEEASCSNRNFILQRHLSSTQISCFIPDPPILEALPCTRLPSVLETSFHARLIIKR